MKKSALIGYTGFVGTTLRRQASFDCGFNSQNSAEMRGKSFALLVCCGASAEKWKANQNPEADKQNIETLKTNLSQVHADQAILISTVDVFRTPRNVYEEDAPSKQDLHAYGKHRLELEEFFREHFSTRVVRLPGLFGKGLKKNAIFDLIHHNDVSKIHPESTFQFYDLSRLWQDIQLIIENQINLIHLATEPVSMGRIAREVFSVQLNPPPSAPVHYDFRTSHASLWGKKSGYISDSDEVLQRIRKFVKENG